MTIVPSKRLLGGTALVFLPASLLFVPRLDALAFLAMGCFVLLALYDAQRARAGALPLSIVMPALQRFARDRPGDIAFTATNLAHHALVARLGLSLPPPIESPEESREVMIGAGSAGQQLSWPIIPRERGRYTIEKVYVEIASRWGFWRARTVLPCSAELRVYPNLGAERRSVAAVFLNQGGFGVHAQRQIGKGREFEQLRDYLPGDSYEDIYWKATARRGYPVTRTYQVERTQEVYVILDHSRLSARRLPSANGSNGSQLDRFITAALILGLSAERQGDHFGLLAFSDRVQRYLRANSGHSHFTSCRDLLYTLQPRLVNPDFEEIAGFIRTRLRCRALLVFLTNLDDPVVADSFQRALQVLLKHHVVMVAMITPPSVASIFSGGPVAHGDDIYERLGGHFQWHDLRALQLRLRQQGVSLHAVSHEALAPQLVTQYVNIKQRQIL